MSGAAYKYFPLFREGMKLRIGAVVAGEGTAARIRADAVGKAPLMRSQESAPLIRHVMKHLFSALLVLAIAPSTEAEVFLRKAGQAQFPIGSYELPGTDAALRAMAEAGVNLIRCRDRRDLDRAAAVGVQGWIPLPLHAGTAGGRLRAMIEGVQDHPALAVWEGPDEIVWNFTANSGLFRNGTYPARDEWWRQTSLAVDYSEREAAKVMPNLRAAAALLRQMDIRKRPLWINEAARSDLKFIRQYIDSIDITGCDSYPIHAANRNAIAVADFTERYKRAGRGRAVWMVLQGFAWGELAGRDEPVTYPAFDETRLMAWASIARGAKGILYWGMDAAPPRPAFRESLYAMTNELASLDPFLTTPEAPGVRVDLINSEGFDSPSRGVRLLCRRSGRDWLVGLVNEDNRPHMGVVVTGLREIGRLDLLYGKETAEVVRGEFVTRMLPYEVKVFATSRKWESPRKQGRDFVQP
ncbi:MAG: hypothetical protein HY013_10365 [Candidatus Solibacter usitatus]|nr:hypothetical protein [Candidatus Solibacter usitatus]